MFKSHENRHSRADQQRILNALRLTLQGFFMVTLIYLGRLKVCNMLMHWYINMCDKILLKGRYQSQRKVLKVFQILANLNIIYSQVNDGNPIRMWRCRVEVPGATEPQIRDRILNERHMWDSDLLQWKILYQVDERTQVFQTVIDQMSPHPTRDYCVLR